MKCDILIVAGLWNSGPEHWQTHWEAKYAKWERVAHRDWHAPERDEWVAELDAAIAACDGRPILVAHSLGCMLVAQWAQAGSHLNVAGAFLVAPSDVDAPSYPIDAGGFRPVPMTTLPFPSVVVASTDDPYAEIGRSRAFAQAWGSKLVEIGDAGHINADTGYGPWPEGERMLEAFCSTLQP
ncbi:RBBP9/YdeN family alpha/beta hydrolase [Massilia aerilata]|uniref:RBBP9/YdeN family alpha/beta hydrolase n=1 Tax=Massilia aerilata TaxID=453817 RepID=A0ABW0RWE4_9BURK